MVLRTLLHPATIAIAVLLAAGGVLALALWDSPNGEEGEPAAAGATSPDTTTCVPWLSQIEEGVRRAQALNRLLLVYVSPSGTACPAGTELEQRLFTTQADEVLCTRCVPVRVLLDGPSQGGGRDLLERIGFVVTPALAIVSARGDVLHRQYARLYSAYDFESRVLPGAWDATLGIDELLALLGDAQSRYDDDLRRQEQLQGQAEATARIEEAEILAGWGSLDEAVAVLRKAVDAGHPHAAGGPALAALLERQGRLPDAALVLEQTVAAYPDHEDAESWRGDAARMRLQGAKDAAAAAPARQALEHLAESGSTPRVRIRSRLALAEYYLRAGDTKALQAARVWLDEQVGPGPTAPPAWSPEMLMRVVGLNMQPEPELLDRAGRTMDLLLHTHPHSVTVQKAKHGMFGQLQQMRKMARKAPGPR